MTTDKKTKLKIKTTKSQILFMLAFCLPAFVLYFTFCVYPVFDSFITSFYKWSGYGQKTYLGLNNYRQILSDKIFLKAIGNDFAITLGKEVIILVLSLVFAVSLTRLKLKKAEKAFFRFVFYIPNILSTIIIGTIWVFVYDPKLGLLNGFLKLIGLNSAIPAAGWLVSYPIQSITFVASWCGIGLFMVVLISAITTIPAELYESADMDGAGQWTQLWRITAPAIKGQIIFVVVTIFYQSLGGNFALVLAIVPNGGVNGSATVMGLYVYINSISSNWPKVGYSYAAAIIMLAITAGATFTVRKLLSLFQRDEEGLS